MNIDLFEQALKAVLPEYPDLKSEFSEQAAKMNDVVNGTIITSSKLVTFGDCDDIAIEQAFRALLNVAYANDGHPIQTCLPPVPWPDAQFDHASVKTDTMIFQIYEFQSKGHKFGISLTWGRQPQ